MQSRYRTALKAASGLATVLLALQSNRALANERDPFALPGKDFRTDHADAAGSDISPLTKTENQSNGYVMYADVELNNSKLSGVAKVVEIDGRLSIESAFAFSKGLISYMPQNQFVPLDEISGITYKFDWNFYRLSIAKELRSTGSNLINMQQRSVRSSYASEAITALIFDYDLSLQADSSGARANGLISPRVVHGDTAFEANVRLSSFRNSQGGTITRLDTALTQRLPGSTARLTIGDFISQTPLGSRAVRMGGVRFGTDFSVRPDLITQPLPDFVGTVAVPTGIDVIVNDRRVATSDIRPGEFTVQAVPVPFGRNEVGVIVRDALGRESLQSVPFYSSRRMLAPGLFEGAVNFGAIRRRYGIVSNDYAALAASGMARRGLSKKLTLTVMGEATTGLVNVGVGADFVIADLAILSATARTSVAEDAFGSSRSGTMLSGGVESAGQDFSISVEARKVSRNFADIASVNGDAAPPSLLAANLNFDLADYGQLQLSAIRQWRDAIPFRDLRSERISVLSASYRAQLGRNVSFSFDVANRNNNGRNNWSALLGLSISLGQRSFAQASYSRSQGQDFFQAGVTRTALEVGDTGLSANVGLGTVNRFATSVSRMEYWGNIEAQAEHVDGSIAGRLNARGAVILAGGSVFASQTDGTGFILVDSAGIGGIEVERENRQVGKTNAQGRLLIGNIPAYNQIKIGVATKNLPLDVVLSSTEEFVSASPGAVSRLKLPVQRYSPVLIRLTDQRDRPFQPGTQLIAFPSKKKYMVGIDSVIELNGSAGDTRLKVFNSDGSTCDAELLDLISQSDGNESLPSLRCYMRSRTIVLTAPPKRPAR